MRIVISYQFLAKTETVWKAIKIDVAKQNLLLDIKLSKIIFVLFPEISKIIVFVDYFFNNYYANSLKILNPRSIFQMFTGFEFQMNYVKMAAAK